MSLSADEGPLGDERWDAIAQDFAAEMGFTEASGKAPIRWVAIHQGVSVNGNDHIHIAATMVREDGTRWDGRFNDYKTVQTAPKELAERVRSAAAASSSEAEWVRRVRDARVVIKPRFAAGGTDVVSGYSVALKPADCNEKLVFYGGGQLGKDLRLGSIRRMWVEPSVGEAEDAAAAGEWQAAFRGQPPVVRDGRETGDLGRVNVDRVVGRLTGYSDRLGVDQAEARGVWEAAQIWADLDQERLPHRRRSGHRPTRQVSPGAPLPGDTGRVGQNGKHAG